MFPLYVSFVCVCMCSHLTLVHTNVVECVLSIMLSNTAVVLTMYIYVCITLISGHICVLSYVQIQFPCDLTNDLLQLV